MIYLNEQKVLFLKPRKVAGTSFEIAMSKFSGPVDVITPIADSDEEIRKSKGYAGPRNFRLPMSKAFFSIGGARAYFSPKVRENWFYNHIPAKLARQRLGSKVFDDSFKISIVRNPFDFCVSLYFWSERKNEKRESFVEWIRKNPEWINKNYEQYFIDGKLVVDYFIRYESLKEDILELERRRPMLKGLYQDFSKINAKSGLRPAEIPISDYYKDEPQLVEAISFFSKQIVDKFGYSYRG